MGPIKAGGGSRPPLVRRKPLIERRRLKINDKFEAHQGLPSVAATLVVAI